MSRGIQSVNPATGEIVRRFEPHSDLEVERRLQAAADAYVEYRETSIAERSRLMLRLAELLESEKAQHAHTITLEMGKPIHAAVQEAEKCAAGCRFYAENAERFLADETIATDASSSFVRYQPLGPILAIMPWNFPFWQLFRVAAPALMAGNVALLKHASNVPQCALAIESVIRRAGFPENVFHTLLVGSDGVERLIADRRVRAVTLTGSVAAGSSVGASAGKQIKKTVLELGGSDPFIVMPSANLARAVATAVQARTINNGQSCIAAKRFIVHDKIADEFEHRFVERMAALKVGDPFDKSTDIGPLATEEVRNCLAEQVQKTISMGARVLLGGKAVDGKGYYFSPTVLADIPSGSPAAEEELFGPVASIFRARDVQHAIEIANSTQFGLGASAWTNETAERNELIERLEAGSVFINAMVASDPRLPFGGIKNSGYGRELSRHGMLEFLNLKTVSIKAETGASSATE
jgi:succinate-semialdehyde dehydrogenase / glutarate-semialdehyde dehydrogenase